MSNEAKHEGKCLTLEMALDAIDERDRLKAEKEELLEALLAWKEVSPEKCPFCMEGDDDHSDSPCWRHILTNVAIAKASN